MIFPVCSTRSLRPLLLPTRLPAHLAPHPPPPQPTKVYCILDEFIIGGEIQETSKKVILERIKELDALEG